MSEVKADPKAILRFLKILYGRQAVQDFGGLVELVWDTGPGTKSNRCARWPVAELEACAETASRLSDQGCKLYVGAGLRDPDADWRHPDYPELPRHSTNNDITGLPALFWDCDDEGAAQAAIEVCGKIGLDLHLVVQTATVPHFRAQLWVLLDEPCEDFAKFKRALELGIALFKADPKAKDLRRVMRLGGAVAPARKAGRISEVAVLRDDLMSYRPAYTIDEVLAILEAHAPTTALVRQLDRKHAQLVADEQVELPSGSIWRLSEVTMEAVGNIALGQQMNNSLWALALAAARDAWDAEIIEANLRKVLDASPCKDIRPDRWKELSKELPNMVKRAIADAGVPASAEPPGPIEAEFEPSNDDTPLDGREQMFRDFRWCGRYERAIRVDSAELYKRQRLDAECYEVGPAGTTRSAWMVFTQQGHSRQDVEGLLFWPGAPRLHELKTPLGDLPAGLYVNEWFPPERELPRGVPDSAVQPFLDLAKVVIPDDFERKTVLRWCAWVAQNPHLKPNWAIVLGSTQQGMGKDLFLEALRVAVQRRYVAEISAPDLLDQNNGSFLIRRKLVIVQEMHSFKQIDTSNILKPLIAAPPYTLRAKEKYQVARDVPNLIACVFMSNDQNALSISKGDRRTFVSWNHGDPMPESYYAAYVEWLAAGGAALAAGWLLSQDVSAFDPRGRAPWTQAKEDMRRASMDPVQEWIEDCIVERDPPFHVDIVTVQAVADAARPMLAVGQKLDPRKTRRLLEAAGCHSLGRARDNDGQRISLWSCRDHVRYAGMKAITAKDARADQLAKTAETPLLEAA